MSTIDHDPMMVLTPYLIAAGATGAVELPVGQRDRPTAPPNNRIFKVPQGVHQAQIIWHGEIPLTLHLDESQTGSAWRKIGDIPGGPNSTPTMIPIISRGEYGRLYFGASRTVTEDDLGPGKITALGVTIFINPARSTA